MDFLNFTQVFSDEEEDDEYSYNLLTNKNKQKNISAESGPTDSSIKMIILIFVGRVSNHQHTIKIQN